MSKMSNKYIAKIFRDIADKIENDTCGVDYEELEAIASNLIHIKLYIEDACKYLNCSRATLHRMMGDRRIPLPRKEPGGKEYWYQDELDKYIAEHK